MASSLISKDSKVTWSFVSTKALIDQKSEETMHAVVVRKCKDVKSQLESKIYKTLQLVRLAQTFCALLYY